ncbi:MAG: hypothetical protein IBJ13_16335, partial [Sphingopyxis sp.]|nr:hypothetical protein [Sphingopyxis sp.]
MAGMKNLGKPADGVRVVTRFFPVSAALRPYCSIIYLTEVDTPPGTRVEDYLHPEWANLRFIDGDRSMTDPDGTLAPHFVVTGPTSKATYFAAGKTVLTSIGMPPTAGPKSLELPAAA